MNLILFHFYGLMIFTKKIHLMLNIVFHVLCLGLYAFPSYLTVPFVMIQQSGSISKKSNTLLKGSQQTFALMKKSWRRLQDVLKTSWRCIEENVLQARLEDVFQRRLPKTCWRHIEDILKTSLEDVLQIRLEDFLKTSWKIKNCYTKVVFKTSWSYFGKQKIFSGLILNLHAGDSKTSFNELSDATEFYHVFRSTLGDSSFDLQKWISNNFEFNKYFQTKIMTGWNWLN